MTCNPREVHHWDIDNSETASTLKCHNVLVFFTSLTHLYYFCSPRHKHFKNATRFFWLKFKRSNWQNTARFLCERVHILVCSDMYLVSRAHLGLQWHVFSFTWQIWEQTSDIPLQKKVPWGIPTIGIHLSQLTVFQFLMSSLRTLE